MPCTKESEARIGTTVQLVVWDLFNGCVFDLRISSKPMLSLKVIQKYLGHSSLQTTMVYLHLTETAEANAREVIEDLFGKMPGQNDDDDNAAGSLAKLK